MASSDIKPYPLMFDPSQWANKYSPFANQALPFMGQYAGTPTDAQGNPIQSYLDAQAAHDAWTPPAQAAAAPATGTTLNTSPGAGYFQQAGPSQALGAQIAPQGSQPGTQALYGRNFAAFAPPAGSPLPPGSLYGAGGQAGVGGQQRAAPAALTPTNPIDMNAAYLQALSNPGKVTTPGATVPQSAPPSGQSGVLQQFLQNWQGGGGNTQGAGNYNNKGFFNALQGNV